MLALPLRIISTGLEREDNIKQALDHSLRLLLTTPRFSTPADPNFGFVFNNLRFEIFNENEGVVYNSDETEETHGLTGLYNKKISGSSKNLNTFAAELKNVVKTYEKRLSQIAVTMTYIREEKMIYITIKGMIINTQEEYTYTTTIKVWN